MVLAVIQQLMAAPAVLVVAVLLVLVLQDTVLAVLQQQDKVTRVVVDRCGMALTAGQLVAVVVLVVKDTLPQTMIQAAELPVPVLVAPAYHHLLQALL
jgi:hypothetical protein